MKNILIGVCGGISCYKVIDIANILTKMGFNVNVIMTENACKFITPLIFQTLTKNEVIVNMFDKHEGFDVKHISLATKADLVLVAPATANIIGKIANGIADDMLTSTLLAAKCPILVAPAMNDNMYSNSIVQDNLKKLEKFGFHIIEPQEGNLACGTIGKGKLASKETILNKVKELLN